ncbi:WD repeat protein [Pseudohyphozyma bogoriensis]|nr:WD repeat protein [Pseudohyphozyma bogoriensis]
MVEPATTLSTDDTVFSADAIEFCPVNSRIFACGTYQIQKEEVAPPTPAEEEDGESKTPVVTRFGRCLMYEIDESGKQLNEIQRFEGPAILDMKWSTRWNNQTTLAIADAKGHIQLQKWDSDNNRLLPPMSLSIADESTLCLSLDWSDRRGVSGPAAMVVSMSDGNLCTLGGETELEVVDTWKAHDFEPWIAAFDCWNPNVVWSGGDDCKMKGWDLRTGFEGGVTSIQSHPLRENIIAVGSYDTQIHLFDRRSPLTPLATHNSLGGIWRLKWHATNPDRLLIAAMHGGFEVVDWDFSSSPSNAGSEGKWEVGGAEQKASFLGHESLAYGVDWSGGRDAEGRDLVASCSFYDHKREEAVDKIRLARLDISSTLAGAKLHTSTP